MKRILLVMALLLTCALDGWEHYREQRQILDLQFSHDLVVLQRDLIALRLYVELNKPHPCPDAEETLPTLKHPPQIIPKFVRPPIDCTEPLWNFEQRCSRTRWI